MPDFVAYREKVVVFTGSGVSAPSGIPTFRSVDGLWRQHRVEELASPDAWTRRPELVLEFYNERRAHAASVQPNAAHVAIAALERRFDVTVVTQNVDDLHERAGSSRVIHLHGELRKARSSIDDYFITDIGAAPIALGDRCPRGGQLRPHIVWFGEPIMEYAISIERIAVADRVLVVGTSLVVQPAAGLIRHARHLAMRVLVDLELPDNARGFQFVRGSADVVLPALLEEWLKR